MRTFEIGALSIFIRENYSIADMILSKLSPLKTRTENAANSLLAVHFSKFFRIY